MKPTVQQFKQVGHAVFTLKVQFTIKTKSESAQVSKERQSTSILRGSLLVVTCATTRNSTAESCSIPVGSMTNSGSTHTYRSFIIWSWSLKLCRRVRMPKIANITLLITAGGWSSGYSNTSLPRSIIMSRASKKRITSVRHLQDQ